MKKNYMFPQAEICLVQEEDMITTSVGVDLTSAFDICEGDVVSFGDFK